MSGKRIVDLYELREVFSAELHRRKRSSRPGDYAIRPGGEATLYATIGAAKVCASLGLALGTAAEQREWRAAIWSFREPDGGFLGRNGHAAGMTVGALNLLGETEWQPVAGLAPLDPSALPAWLARFDPRRTHKEFGCASLPILVSGFGGAGWAETLYALLEQRVDPARPLELWCAADDPAWKVISCIYHIAEIYDAAARPYPHPQLLWQRLAGLEWPRVRNSVPRTTCTDFDLAWVLVRLCRQLPERLGKTLDILRQVADLRAEEWYENRPQVLADDTHGLHCYLIAAAVFQDILPDLFRGPKLFDCLNASWVHRLPSESVVGPP